MKNARTPTLIVFGQRDERVPPTQGYELYEGLKAGGVEAKLVIYPARATAWWSANTRSTTCGEQSSGSRRIWPRAPIEGGTPRAGLG